MFLPETHNIVKTFDGAANVVAGDYISCKNAAGLIFFLIYHDDTGNDTDLAVSLTEATNVAAGTNAAVTATFPIWADIDCGTSSDTLERQTDAASYVINTGLTPGNNHLVVIAWDPAKHTAGYDCISVTGAGGDGSNTCTVFAIFKNKYAGNPLPSAIID
jgi:hypothetical protein